MKRSVLVLLLMSLTFFAWADDGDDSDDSGDSGDTSASAPAAPAQEDLKLGNRNISGGDGVAQYPRDDDRDN